MTQENKDLLLKDLCARLLYCVKISLNTEGIQNIGVLDALYPNDECIIVDHLEKRFPLKNGYGTVDYGRFSLEESNFKPYLRPMSSMTEEEKEELKSKCIHTETEEDWEGVRCDVWGIQILDKYDTRRWDNPIWPSTINIDAIDWLNAHHFDYCGLIEKGLAIDVTKGGNPYEQSK